MIECTNCGAQGEANFSTNYFGELVCELCGTQSFLQSRNETQDMEDTNLDITKASTMKRNHKRKTKRGSELGSRSRKHYDDDDVAGVGIRGRDSLGRRKKPRRRNNTTLLDCLRATQTILDYQAQSLIQLGGFPDEFADVVQQIWFLFLETWELKSSKPLLRCFTEFYVTRDAEDKAMDPALTAQLLEQWDADRAIETAQEAERAAAIAATAAEADDGEEEQDGEDDDGDDDVESEEDEDEDASSSMRKKKKKSKKAKPRVKKQLKTKKEPRAESGKSKKRGLQHHSATFDRFQIMDLVGMLVLAARILNLGVLPSDFAYWIFTGQLPFHNLLGICTLELQFAVADVSLFFEAAVAGNNRVSAARVAYHAYYLQHHLDLKLPPLNVPLVAYNMCANLGFPPQVFRHFQWVSANFNVKGKMPEKPLLRETQGSKEEEERVAETSVGIVANLAVAVRLCANWHEWIYERVLRRDHHVAQYRLSEARRMPRRELDDFVDVCENALVGIDRANIPPGFQSHVYDLRGKYSELSQSQSQGSGGPVENALHAYPALYVNGICDERDDEIEERIAFIKQMMKEQNKRGSKELEDEANGHDDDDVFFYPHYATKELHRTVHAAFENVLDVLCEYVDVPMGTVIQLIQNIDRQVKVACKALERSVVLVGSSPPPASRDATEPISP